MLLYNAIKLGEAIQKYNRRFTEDMHLDFHEIVEMMYDMDDVEEVEEIINEIERRIEKKKQLDILFLQDRINRKEYRKKIACL